METIGLREVGRSAEITCSRCRHEIVLDRTGTGLGILHCPRCDEVTFYVVVKRAGEVSDGEVK